MGKLREGLSLGILEVKVCVRVLEAKEKKKQSLRRHKGLTSTSPQEMEAEVGPPWSCFEQEEANYVSSSEHPSPWHPESSLEFHHYHYKATH